MNLRGWMLVALGLAAAGWWFSPLSPRVPPVAAIAPGALARCPSPPAFASDGDVPRQTPVPATLAPFRLADAELTPLAGFSVAARVLSREDYHYGRESDLSPTDLALGWGRMREDAVLEHLEISQGGRWYRYAWRGEPPLPPPEIARSSANMHLIPSDAATAAALHRIGRNDRVRIDGWLVEAHASDGWHWRSSLSRDDVGNGACEVVYVCAITRF